MNVSLAEEKERPWCDATFLMPKFPFADAEKNNQLLKFLPAVEKDVTKIVRDKEKPQPTKEKTKARLSFILLDANIDVTPGRDPSAIVFNSSSFYEEVIRIKQVERKSIFFRSYVCAG